MTETEVEVIFVFKWLEAWRNTKLLSEYEKKGWTLINQNSDRFYFQRCIR